MAKSLNNIIINYIDVKANSLKSSTIARYKNLYTNYIEDNLNNVLIHEVTNRLLQDYIDSLLKKKITPIVIKEMILLIKLSLKREAKFGEFVLPLFDLDIPITKKSKKVNTLTRQEERTIIKHIFDNDKQKYSGIVISLLTGMRIGEICALKWNDIDLKKRQISVNKTLQRICIKNKKSTIEIGATKSSSSVRFIPICNVLYDFFISIKPSNRDTYVLTSKTIAKAHLSANNLTN